MAEWFCTMREENSCNKLLGRELGLERISHIISQYGLWIICIIGVHCTLYIERRIPSEMEVAPRYDCLHSWHCWYCWVLTLLTLLTLMTLFTLFTLLTLFTLHNSCPQTLTTLSGARAKAGTIIWPFSVLKVFFVQPWAIRANLSVCCFNLTTFLGAKNQGKP